MSPISLLFHLHAALAAPQDEYNGLTPQSLRKREVADICTRLELNYSGWQLKARIKQGEGFLLNPESKRAALPVADGKRICEHFLEKEKNAADPDLAGLSNEERKFRVAKSNLEYSDRLQSLIASFKDSHLSIWRSTPRAEIFYGFELKEIAGNFYISDISPTRKFSWSETLGLDAPKVGDRVSSWNGQKIESVLKPLMKQVAGSTERAIREDALAALTKRRFAYPDSAILEIGYIPQSQDHEKFATARLYFDEGASDKVIRRASEALNVAQSVDDQAYLKHIGAVDYKSIKLEKKPEGDAHKVKPVIESSSLVKYRNELANHLSGWTRYCNAANQTIAITGKLKSDESVAYIKIYGFLGEDHWTIDSKGNLDCGYGKSLDPEKESVDLKEHLKSFLANFSADKSVPKIILDLRHNGGGEPKSVSKLVSLLLKIGDSARPGLDYKFVSYRSAQIGASLTNPELGYETPDYDQETLRKWSEQFQVERESSGSSKEESKIFISPPLARKRIEADSVFNAKPNVLVWTGPACVSACEKAVLALADNQLARVMGTPTAGTGMGMNSEYETDTSFTTASQMHEIRPFPNYFFGRPNVDSSCEIASLATHTPAQILECRIQGISENRPAKIDLPYEETLEDLLHNGKGWIDQSRSYFSQGSKEEDMHKMPHESHDPGGSPISPIAEPAPAKH